MTAKPKCRICKIRPIDRDSNIDLCEPCETEAGWENTHSDEDHEGVLRGDVKWGQTTHKTKAEFKRWVAECLAGTKECWVCHPELNAAQATYVVRTGTSRAGMVLHVSPRVAPKEKAKQVIDQLSGTTANSPERIYRSKKDSRTYLLMSLETGILQLAWNDQGQYEFAATSWTPKDGNARKVRNVAQALRLARGEKN